MSNENQLCLHKMWSNLSIVQVVNDTISALKYHVSDHPEFENSLYIYIYIYICGTRFAELPLMPDQIRSNVLHMLFLDVTYKLLHFHILTCSIIRNSIKVSRLAHLLPNLHACFIKCVAMLCTFHNFPYVFQGCCARFTTLHKSLSDFRYHMPEHPQFINLQWWYNFEQQLQQRRKNCVQILQRSISCFPLWNVSFLVIRTPPLPLSETCAPMSSHKPSPCRHPYSVGISICERYTSCFHFLTYLVRSVSIWHKDEDVNLSVHGGKHGNHKCRSTLHVCSHSAATTKPQLQTRARTQYKFPSTSMCQNKWLRNGRTSC